jgi:hypothetical protein
MSIIITGNSNIILDYIKEGQPLTPIIIRYFITLVLNFGEVSNLFLTSSFWVAPKTSNRKIQILISHK